jgi:hypothetical protein
VHDTEWWGSSGPMHRWESYGLSEDIPRVLVIPGPHPFMDCQCAVCGPREAALAAGRASRVTSSPPVQPPPPPPRPRRRGRGTATAQ